MNKQELIEEWSSKTGAPEPIIIRESFRYADPAIGIYDQGFLAAQTEILSDLKQLDEPQKPVVPKFVADYIEYCHSDGNSLWEVFRYINKMPNQVWAWLKVEKHQVIFSKAFGDGYEVEKEQLYVMPVPHISFPVHYCVEDDHISFRQGNAQKFTQAELDKYFPDIKQFAVPVEEVEEG
ncbi:hypothetical protein IGK28_001737 [Enterococcus sp. DIV0182]|nr:DUF1642 domain-containing protein [Enterococcus sp. 5B7_DIV0075]OTP23841.1 hypothetical protein A5800_001698 [Enterococcus sp. 5B7_DIV0075]